MNTVRARAEAGAGTRAEVTLSVVVYRDYATPTDMVRTLVEHTDSELSYRLYAVDNSALEAGDPLQGERDAFVALLEGAGMCEYVDAGGNLGFGGANNVALAMADSEYHVFVNPDILFVEDALSELKAFMDRRSDVGMCIPRMVDEQGELLHVCRRGITILDAFNRMVLKNGLTKRDEYHAMKGEDYSRPFRVPFGQGSFLFGRTALLKRLGGFDESFFMYLEDADLCRRVNEESSLYYCPDATVVHKWERGSHKDLWLLREHLRSYAVYFRKWGLSLA